MVSPLRLDTSFCYSMDELPERDVPIYRRSRIYLEHRARIINENDAKFADERLQPPKESNRFARSFDIMADIGPPKVTYVGSSHVHHLMEMKFSESLPEHTRTFLSKSAFVGCGGLKFWSCKDELNGVFTSQYKLEKYGDLWHKYSVLDFKPDWVVTILGSNDCDDYWGYLMRFLAEEGKEKYQLHLENDIHIWIEALIPHIVNYFKTLQEKCKNACLAYVQILPRDWWCDSTQELTRKIEGFIGYNLRVDYGIRVKIIHPHSLLYFGVESTESHNFENATVRGFLDPADEVHLNPKGYQALVNEIAIPLMDQRAFALDYRSSNFPGKNRKSQLRKRRFNIY